MERLFGIPASETERKQQAARAAAVDALWRARNAETVHGFASPEHRAAINVFTVLSDYSRTLASEADNA